MSSVSKREELRIKRHKRVRKRVVGTPSKPRLCVFRSLKHIYAQIIEDEQGRTLVSASSADPEIREKAKHGGNIEVAKVVGELIAIRALTKGIDTVVFDRGGWIYHGRVRALAEAARQGGLQF